MGEYDIPDVQAHAGVIEAGIPNAKREIISNSGHLIPLEQPKAFNGAIKKFLADLRFYKVLNSEGVDAAVKNFHNQKEVAQGTRSRDTQDAARGFSFLRLLA